MPAQHPIQPTSPLPPRVPNRIIARDVVDEWLRGDDANIGPNYRPPRPGLLRSEERKRKTREARRDKDVVEEKKVLPPPSYFQWGSDSDDLATQPISPTYFGHPSPTHGKYIQISSIMSWMPLATIHAQKAALATQPAVSKPPKSQKYLAMEIKVNPAPGQDVNAGASGKRKGRKQDNEAKQGPSSTKRRKNTLTPAHYTIKRSYQWEEGTTPDRRLGHVKYPEGHKFPHVPRKAEYVSAFLPLIGSNPGSSDGGNGVRVEMQDVEREVEEREKTPITRSKSGGFGGGDARGGGGGGLCRAG